MPALFVAIAFALLSAGGVAVASQNAEPGDGEGGEHDGQVRVDGFTLPTRPGPYARTYARHRRRLRTPISRKPRPPQRL